MRTSFLLLFIAICCQEYSAQIYSSFDYKKGKLATVLAMENDDPEESFLLAFRFKSHVNLVFLDDSLRLKRMLKTEPFNSDAWDRNVSGIVNFEKQLYVFMPAGNFGTTTQTDLYKFDKESGSVEIFPLRLFPDKEKELSNGRVRLIKVFQFENRFYKIWVNPKSAKLYIFYYEMGEADHMDFQSIDLPHEDIAKRLGQRKVVPTPVITDYRDASLISNAKEEKIYMFEGEMLFTLEDHEKGQTDLLAINTNTWEISQESYPVQGYLAGANQQNFNSFIYGGHIFQVLYNEEGLRINKTAFEDNLLVMDRSWTSEETFVEDFPLGRMRRFTGNRLVENDVDKPWNWFSRSIALVIQPEESEERLIVGSHIYLDQRGRDILNTVALISAIGGSAVGAAGFTTLGNGGNFSIYVDPFSAINSIIDATFYFSEGRMVQFDTYFDSESFDIIHDEISPSRWDQVMARVNQEENERRLHSVTLFERGDKIYFGYWSKKRYYLMEF